MRVRRRNENRTEIIQILLYWVIARQNKINSHYVQKIDKRK